jgi:hypothetical protein
MAVCLALPICGATGLAADDIRGEYLEARNADIWTGPCFANGEVNIIGNKATLAWKVTSGSYGGVDLSGKSVVVVVFGDKTFGLGDPVKTRSVLLVDSSANASERQALIGMAKRMSGDLIQEVVAVESVAIKMSTGLCDKRGCAHLDAGVVKISTRCLHEGDSICGHEDLFYPVMAPCDQPYAAYTSEYVFTGQQMGETFAHGNSRSAVLGTFDMTEPETLAAR